MVQDLIQDKEQIVNHQKLLELRHPMVTFDDVVGLDNLRAWFHELFDFGESFLSLGVDAMPKGVLLGGISGCGKSLSAQAIAGTLRWPLLRMDPGSIFGGRLGSSEANMRSALELAEQLSPVVLLVDEIERGFGQGGGRGDATQQRVLQTFLTWMQERKLPIFLVATANDVMTLPPELLRAGRFDAAFFLDLPNEKERHHLLERGLKRHGRDGGEVNFAELARTTAGFSSAELLGRVENALFVAARERQLNPTQDQLRDALMAHPLPPEPLSERWRREDDMRQLWSTIARPASRTSSAL